MQRQQENHDPIHIAWGLLPYIATILGVWILDQPLLAVAVYHVGIVFLIRRHPTVLSGLLQGGKMPVLLGMSLLCLAVWPLLVALWPYVSLPGTDLADVLRQWGLQGNLVLGFMIYSVTVHPVLEELFWRGLMPDHVGSDMLFAGFHVLVLILFLQGPWVVFGFGVLFLGSFLWRRIVHSTGGLMIPVVSHAVADLAIILGVIHFVRGK